MNIEKLINQFFYFYFNPRTEIKKSIFNSNKWIYENQFLVEDDLIIFSSYYLFFSSKVGNNKKEISDNINIFFKEHVNIKHPGLKSEKDVTYFFDIILSMVSIFYIDTTALYKNILFDNKAIALYQLSKTAQSNHNDRVRTSYIRYLLYNSYLYDARTRLNIKNNRLFFKSGKSGYILFLDILDSIEPKKNNLLINNLLESILLFLKELTIFFEQGSSIPIIENIDDMYLKYAHYSHFIPLKIKGKIKRTSFKMIADILIESTILEGSSTNKFITSAILFNYMNLNYITKHAKIRSYWEKSSIINSSLLKQIETKIKIYFDSQFDFYSKQIRLKIRQNNNSKP